MPMSKAASSHPAVAEVVEGFVVFECSAVAELFVCAAGVHGERCFLLAGESAVFG
jgi:hypothetical protein